VLKVTTAPTTAVPVASFRVAFTVAGVPLVMELTGTPLLLVSVITKPGTVLTGVSRLPAPQPVSITATDKKK